jgi:hypothetical protein
MTTDYRAELQRLVQAYDEHGGKWPDAHEQALFQAVEAARATLAQPEPQRLTVQECNDMRKHGENYICESRDGKEIQLDGYFTREDLIELANTQPTTH